MPDLLKEILEEFENLSLKKQIEIFWEFVDYVENYPEEHDEGSYPVCFLEWYSNDYQELHQERR